jgi:hypothetical protein
MEKPGCPSWMYGIPVDLSGYEIVDIQRAISRAKEVFVDPLGDKERESATKIGLAGEAAACKWLEGSIDSWIHESENWSRFRINSPDLVNYPTVEVKTIRPWHKLLPLAPAGQKCVDQTKDYLCMVGFGHWYDPDEGGEPRIRYWVKGWIAGTEARDVHMNETKTHMESGTPALPTWRLNNPESFPWKK